MSYRDQIIEQRKNRREEREQRKIENREKEWAFVQLRIDKKLLNSVKAFVKSEDNENNWTYKEYLEFNLSEGLRITMSNLESELVEELK